MQTIHGGDVYRNPDCIDFSANINPLGTPDSVKSAISDSITNIHNYPDIYCANLKDKLAEFHNIDANQLICGNGAADIIFRFVFALRPEHAVVLDPCFAEYGQALKYIGATLHHYRLNQESFCIEEDFLDELTEETDVVFLCNPNNPTGRLIPQELLLRISDRCRDFGIKLFLDECFMDFLPDEDKRSLIQTAGKQPHIFILRAFTKMYAIPGIRLGYGICSDLQLINEMEQAGAPWNVSVPAQAAGVAALGEEDFVENTINYIAREREYLENELDRLDITFWHGSANFIFLYDPRDLRQGLLDNRILIRDCSNYESLSKGFYRIAVKDRTSNRKLIEVLESLNSR